MGYNGKLLIAVCDQQPATSFTAWLPLLYPERRERKLKQLSVPVSCTLKDGEKRQAKQTWHIIITALHALFLTAQKKHIWRKRL